jgi:hypothetical protein
MLIVLVGLWANSRHEVEKFRVEFGVLSLEGGVWSLEFGGWSLEGLNSGRATRDANDSGSGYKV